MTGLLVIVVLFAAISCGDDQTGVEAPPEETTPARQAPTDEARDEPTQAEDEARDEPTQAELEAAERAEARAERRQRARERRARERRARARRARAAARERERQERALARQREQEQEQAATANCHPSYAGACIPADRGDVDCTEIPDTDFRVVGEDVYGLDGAGGDRGIACESD